MSILASIFGKALAARLAPFVPAIGVVLLVIALLFFLWLGFDRWRDSLFHAGELAERAKWEALDLAVRARNAEVRAARTEAALEESRRNAATNESLKELAQDLVSRIAARNRDLERAWAVTTGELFDAPMPPDDCRLVVSDRFVREHDSAGRDGARD